MTTDPAVHSPLDPEVAGVLQALANAGMRPVHELDPVAAREQLALMTQPPGGPPELQAVEEVTIDGPAGRLTGRLYRPGAAPSAATVLFFHGGGWVLGSIDGSDALCRTLAARTGLDVVSAGYRLAPEDPYPAAVDDAYAWTEWVAGRPARLVIMGESAGATLAAACAQRACSGGLEVDLQVLIYPVTDHDFGRPSYAEHGEGYLLDVAQLAWCWDHYVPDVERRSDPGASPLRSSSLTGLPPTILVQADHDCLLDEGNAYAERLRESGVAVTQNVYPGTIHGFFGMVAALRIAARAVDETADAIRRAVV